MKRLLVLLLIAIPVSAIDSPDLTLTKRAYESFDTSLDFKNRTASVELDSCTAVNQANNLDATAQVIAAIPAPGVVSSTKVVWRVQGGKSGSEFLVRIRVHNPTTKETFEGIVDLRVN
jgi:hypothetical protein